jgi:hypothetical protein
MENNKRVVLNYMFYKICMFYKVPKVCFHKICGFSVELLERVVGPVLR